MHIFVLELSIDYEGGSDLVLYANEQLARQEAQELMKVKAALWRIRKREPGLSFMFGAPDPKLLEEWHSPIRQETIKLWRLRVNDGK